MDYEEAIALVAKMTIVRTLIVVASVCQWKISQMDVKDTFLNGDLHEEVYMMPPPGVPRHLGEVYKLHNAFYGLKQGPHAWFEKFSMEITSLTFFLVTMIRHDHNSIESLKSELAHSLSMKDLDILRYFLGIEVDYSPKGYLLSQSKYITDLFEHARLTNNRIVDTPLKTNAKYSSSDAFLWRILVFIVPLLAYLTVIRPNIAHAVHVVSQFVTAPITVHWAIFLRILMYLRGTQFHSLLFPSTSSLELCTYSDADWASDPTDRKSTIRYCIFLYDSLISWKSKKQDVISRSSIEAEYHAIALTTYEIVWLGWLLTDMGISITHPTLLHCDN
ncbi:uncharacterized mitochondrial protein AtMg00810-like [Impatiens glandulifera]|uniref:uncharacterized mitochondrial protein AtMg00810-like n=1 Tax=Impatiens glandulifera TaxID=253017 RepID=UPI001FB093AE|nr:uncharacterized mitochondrial protein AtMg00810-like [Impatiens glandulifera]